MAYIHGCLEQIQSEVDMRAGKPLEIILEETNSSEEEKNNFSSADAFNVLDLGYVPPTVAIEDLSFEESKPRLINSDTASKIVNALGGQKDGRYSKKTQPLSTLELKLNYSIIKEAGEYYAIYYGVTQGKQAGQGSFGAVKFAQNIQTGAWVVLKVQNADIEVAKAEAKTLRDLGRSQSDTGHQAWSKKVAKANRLQHYTIMTCYPGKNLKQFFSSTRKISNQSRCKIALNLLTKANEFTEKRLLHRDIKPGNYMIDPLTHEVALVDVGFVEQMNQTNYSYSGTKFYLSPEVNNSRQYSEKSEVYALGITLKQLFGIQTYDDDDTQHFVPNGPLNQKVTPFLNRMTDKDPAQRPTVKNAMIFFEKLQIPDDHYKKRIGILDLAVYTRLGAQDQHKYLCDAFHDKDEIVLIDQMGSTHKSKEYLALIRELEQRRYLVQPQIFRYAQGQLRALVDSLKSKFGYDAHVQYLSKQDSDCLIPLNQDRKQAAHTIVGMIQILDKWVQYKKNKLNRPKIVTLFSSRISDLENQRITVWTNVKDRLITLNQAISQKIGDNCMEKNDFIGLEIKGILSEGIKQMIGDSINIYKTHQKNIDDLTFGKIYDAAAQTFYQTYPNVFIETITDAINSFGADTVTRDAIKKALIAPLPELQGGDLSRFEQKPTNLKYHLHD